VLYLLRGAASEWINKEQDPTRSGRNVIDVYEELLAGGSVGPMIFVFPGSASDDNAVPGMMTNFKAPHLTQAAGIGTGRFEDFFIRELIPFVDATYRTVAARAGRGIVGFSLGGFISAKLAAKFPGMFSTAGTFDGTHFYAAADSTQVDAERDRITFHNPMFDPVFDRPRDTAFAALNNGPNLVSNSSAAAMQSIAWFVQYGPREAEPGDSNFFRGEHLLEKLREKGVTNGVTPVLRGGHNWKTADEHIRQTLPLHWKVLGAVR
jgi:enterochelin esterase-like enzyme